MYGKYSLFYESLKTWDTMCIHKQGVPGLFSGGGGRGEGWNEPNGGVEYDIIFKSYAVTILTSIVNLVCQTPAVKGQD